MYGIPSGTPLIQAVIGNLTGIAPTQGTYLTLYPANLTRAPNASDINVAAGEVLANLVAVQLDTSGPNLGDVELYNGAGYTDAILDIEGWFQ